MKRVFLILVGVVVVAALVLALGLPRYEKLQLAAPKAWPGGKTAIFRVEDGLGARQIATGLAKSGLIRNATAFVRMLRKQGLEGKLKPGVYQFEPGTDAHRIARDLVDHKTLQFKLTVPEGLTLKQIGQRLAKAGEANGQQYSPSAAEFLKAATGAAVRRATGLPVKAPTAEGYLFPATYTFAAGTGADDIVARLAQEFAKRFTGRYDADLRRSRLTLAELVTLASIVEREAELPAERPVIAGVFLNRLQRGMKLESCATVQYALPRHKSRLLFADLKLDSPYNTYLHAGLPPGPICNPGLASLQAALRPAKTGALYFVAKGGGGHVFTRTFAEHQAAIRSIRGGGAATSGGR
jgi:UPF0755 protein